MKTSISIAAAASTMLLVGCGGGGGGGDIFKNADIDTPPDAMEVSAAVIAMTSPSGGTTTLSTDAGSGTTGGMRVLNYVYPRHSTASSDRKTATATTASGDCSHGGSWIDYAEQRDIGSPFAAGMFNIDGTEHFSCREEDPDLGITTIVDGRDETGSPATSVPDWTVSYARIGSDAEAQTLRMITTQPDYVMDGLFAMTARSDAQDHNTTSRYEEQFVMDVAYAYKLRHSSGQSASGRVELEFGSAAEPFLFITDEAGVQMMDGWIRYGIDGDGVAACALGVVHIDATHNPDNTGSMQLTAGNLEASVTYAPDPATGELEYTVVTAGGQATYSQEQVDQMAACTMPG